VYAADANIVAHVATFLLSLFLEDLSATICCHCYAQRVLCLELLSNAMQLPNTAMVRSLLAQYRREYGGRDILEGAVVTSLKKREMEQIVHDGEENLPFEAANVVADQSPEPWTIRSWHSSFCLCCLGWQKQHGTW
jgi:hypothetical protein